MKLVRKARRKAFKVGANCIVYEYRMADKDINGALAKLYGRHPVKGYVVNKKCKELVYVIKGKGKIVFEDKEVKLAEGDVALIGAGEKYYWNGNMLIFIPCTPAWYPKQHVMVR